MVIANKRSFDARLYINDKVDEMKEQLKNVTDEGARKQLLENFKALKSSEEYQKKLGIVAKDTKELKSALSNPTADKVQSMKETFYGKIGTYLGSEDFETFEEIDNVADKIEFLFKKLGDGDETLSCILDPRCIIDPEKKDCCPRCFMGDFMGHHRDDGRDYFEDLYEKKHDKVREDLFYYEKWIKNNLYNNRFHNLSLNMAKKLIRSEFSDLILRNPGAFSKDVFKDEEIIKFVNSVLVSSGNKDLKWDNLFYKMGKEGKDYILKNCRINSAKRIIENLQGTKTLSQNFGKRLIRNALNNYIDPSYFSEFIRSGKLSNEPWVSYQKEIAYGAINSGVNGVVKENIDYFTELTDDEKNELLGKLTKSLTTNISGNGELIENLLGFREILRREMDFNGDIEEKIVKASRKVKVKLELDSDGSRLIKFKLGNKSYTILDPKLKGHSDAEYGVRTSYSIIEDADTVKLGGMIGDDVNKWDNKLLKEYVQEKENEGLHIASEQEVKNLLEELGNLAGIENKQYKEHYEILMLIYLAGMNGRYWLSMCDSNLRSKLYCYVNRPGIESIKVGLNGFDDASLLMIACK